jgi:hypothetical protein
MNYILIKCFFKKSELSSVQVAHACNPSYSGRQRSGESRFKASLEKQFVRPILKNPSQNMADGVVKGVGPEFKPQFCNK